MHACDIIDFFELPIGQLSEGKLDSLWKLDTTLECNSRKTSRTDANTDIIKTLLLTSDPQLSSYRQSLNNKNKNNLFDNEIRQYLVIKESHDSDSLLDIPEDVINAIDSDTEDDN